MEGPGPPRIVKDRRRKRAVIRPPRPEGYGIYDVKQPPSDEVDIYVSRGGMEVLVQHCEGQAGRDLEAMGFLVGDVFSWNGRAYVVARDAVTTELDASPVSVRFQRDAFPELFKRLDSLTYDYIIVGWYHSHPGYGCFLSDTDIQTQIGGFSEEHQFALVVDPVRREMKAFRLGGEGSDQDPEGYREVSLGVFGLDEWSWPGRRR